jgi:predicted ferric reductase
MGMNMKTTTHTSFLTRSILVYTAIPLLIFLLENQTKRALYKEIISLVTILSYCLLTGQFFWSRLNYYATRATAAKKLLTLHNTMGCICILVLLLHPLLLVIPRFIEKGISPADALLVIFTTFTGKGVVLGIIAWSLMVIIGLTSLLRKKMGMQYPDWQKLHGILSLLFIVAATWHAIELGRHTTFAMSRLFIVFASGSVLLLAAKYTFQKSTKAECNNEAL